MAENAYAAIKIRDFRLLLCARTLVTIAVQIQGMAVGWQMYSLTHNALALGLIGLSEALPAIGVALYAGHVADIADRRRIILFSVFTLTVCMALLSFSSFALAQHEALQWIIYAVVGLSGFARGFYGPGIFGLTSDIVPREHYGNAAAWQSAFWQGSSVAGPMIGGALYIWLNASLTYLVSAISLSAAFCLFLLVKARTVHSQSGEKVSVVDNIAQGVRFVFSNQVILGAMAMDLFAVLFGGAVALLPIFTKEIFHMGPQALGVLRAAPCVGAFCTATILTHHPIASHTGKVFLCVVAGFGLCMIAFGLSSNFYLSFVLLAMSGVLDGISVWTRSTIYQLLTPNDMKGRIASVNSMFIGSSNEIGEFESGVTAKLMGLVPSVVFGGCMTLLVVLYAAIKAPKLRNLHMHDLYKQSEELGQKNPA
ncbi:MAG TPA: MFS transporter [Trichormus sp.]|jgi:MFS family permease